MKITWASWRNKLKNNGFFCVHTKRLNCFLPWSWLSLVPFICSNLKQKNRFICSVPSGFAGTRLHWFCSFLKCGVNHKPGSCGSEFTPCSSSDPNWTFSPLGVRFGGWPLTSRGRGSQLISLANGIFCCSSIRVRSTLICYICARVCARVMSRFRFSQTRRSFEQSSSNVFKANASAENQAGGSPRPPFP